MFFAAQNIQEHFDFYMLFLDHKSGLGGSEHYLKSHDRDWVVLGLNQYNPYHVSATRLRTAKLMILFTVATSNYPHMSGAISSRLRSSS